MLQNAEQVAWSHEDLVRIKWIVAEAESTLKQAQQSLELYAAELESSSELENFKTLLHQVHGSLVMVDLVGPAFLIEELEKLADKLLQNELEDSGKALELLLESILQLPALLSQNIKPPFSNRPIIPIILLNKLRTFLQEPLISELLWFKPSWQGADRLIQALPKAVIVDQLDLLLKKIRQLFQIALLGIIRQQDVQNNLEFLSKALLRLQKITSGYRVYQLWWVSYAFVECLLAGNIVLDGQAKSMLGKIDRQLKVFAATHEPTEDILPPKELMAEILFKLAKVNSSFSKLKQIKRVYGLDHALASCDVQLGSGQFLAIEKNTIQIAMSAVLEEMAVIKDVLDVFVRGGFTQPDQIKDQLTNLKRLADTLALLGVHQGKRILLSQVALLTRTLKDPSLDFNQTSIEVAGAILYVESVVRGILNHPEDWAGIEIQPTELHADIENQTQNTLMHDRSDYGSYSMKPAAEELLSAQSSLIREIRLTIESLESDFSQFVSSGSSECYTLIQHHFFNLKGSCTLLGYRPCIVWVESCCEFFESLLRHTSPQEASNENVSLFSEGISAIDYFLQHFISFGATDLQSIDTAITHPSLLKLQAKLQEKFQARQEVAVSYQAPVPLSVLELEEDEKSQVALDVLLVQDNILDDSSIVFTEQVIDDVTEQVIDDVTEQVIDEVLVESVIAEKGQIQRPSDQPTVLPGYIEFYNKLSDMTSHDLAIDSETKDIFLEEAQEILVELQKHLLVLKKQANNQHALIECRRAFHTLKGSGRLVGAEVVGEMAYFIEDLFNRMLDGTVKFTEAALQVFEETILYLPEMIDVLMSGGKSNIDLIALIICKANLLSKGQNVILNLAEKKTDDDAEPLSEALKLEEKVLNTTSEDAHQFEAEQFEAEQLKEEQPVQSEQTSFLAEQDQTLFDIFYKEAQGHLLVIYTFIEDSHKGNAQFFSEKLFRALHTLKGSANMAGMDRFSQAVTPVEGLIKNLSKLGIAPDSETLALLVEMAAILSRALNRAEASFPVPDADIEIITGWVRALKLKYFKSSEEDRAVLTAEQLNHQNKVKSLLQEAMSLIILAMEYFTEWRHHNKTLSLLTELDITLMSIAELAKNIDLKGMEDLSRILAGCYRAIFNADLQVQPPIEEAFYELAASAHECLVEMIDVLAVGSIPAYPVSFINELTAYQEKWYETAQAEQPLVMAISETILVVEPIAEKELIAEKAVDEKLEDQAMMESVTDADLLDIFLEEAQEITEKATENFHQLSDAPFAAAVELISEMLRLLHTLKGGARLSGLMQLGNFIHHLESIYEKLESHFSILFPKASLLLSKAHDGLQDAVEHLKNEGLIKIQSSLFHELKSFSAGLTSLLQLPREANLEEALRQPLAQSAEIITLPEPQLASIVAPELMPPPTPAAVVSSSVMPVKPIMTEQIKKEPLLPEPVATFEKEPSFPDIDWEILHIFINEADELLESMDHFIDEWQRSPNQVEINHSIQRLLHTLKGGARLSHQITLADACHTFEDYLQDIVVNQRSMVPAFFSEVRQRREAVMHYLDESKAIYKRYTETDEAKMDGVFPDRSKEADAQETDEVINWDEDEDVILNIGATDAQMKALFEQESQNKEPIRVQNDLLENLVNLVGETAVQRGLVEQEVHDFSRILEDLAYTVNRLKDQLRYLELETETHILSRYEVEKSAAGQYADFDPLEMDQYSQLNFLTRGLTESASDIQDIKDSLLNKARDAEYSITRLGRTNREVQESLLRVRMTPLSRITPKLRKLVRQVSEELNKEVELDVVNPEGELDRTVLEKITVPFEHMIRNAIDHGLETKEERLNKGKSPIGRITLQIIREGSEIVVSLSDDGKGIPIDSVRKKAISLKMIDEETPYSDDDILQFIFKPGFSTAEKITHISGRGVGMDVVYNQIKQLNGTMKITSAKEVGTKFTIRLPFTVSITRVLMVLVGEEIYAIPITQIEGVIRVNINELRASYKPNAPGLNYNENIYRLLYLGHFVQNILAPDLEGQTRPLPVLLVRGGEQATAIQVDGIIGARDVVLKSVGKQLSSVSGISGATIMGDGSVMVILELMSLLRAQRASDLRGLVASTQRRISRENIMVLVVDDSVTVRKVTSRLLERQGMEVMTAKDGVDAMQIMHDQVPDIVLLDVEMPRMDGFEVASQMRHIARLSKVPIVMITSRTGEKHKQRAEGLGVNEYLGKPFQEGQLLKVIQTLTS